MQRLSPEVVGYGPVIQLRDEIAVENGRVLGRGAGVFDLARSFLPEKLEHIPIISRIGKLVEPTDKVSAEGYKILRVLPIPEQPTEYVTPAIVLPARNFTHPKTRETVQRRVAMRLSIWFDYEDQSGVKNDLPLPTPVPDRMSLTGKPIALTDDRYEESDVLTPILTVSGNYVQVYKDEGWECTDLPIHQTLPNENTQRELHDWNTVLAYPPEALQKDILILHRNNAKFFLQQLGIIELSLTDPMLNPRPVRS